LLLIYFEIPSLLTESIGVGFSIFLGSITCPGSMGMISARFLEHPFEISTKLVNK
jgi:hypothetical protein